MKDRKSYRLSDLLAQCDRHAPMPESLREWEQMAPVGLERLDAMPLEPTSDTPTSKSD